MKLAQALIERKAIKTKIEELKKRIYQSAKIQEGDSSIEDPLELIKELETEIQKYTEIIYKINKTNNVTQVADGLSLMEAIVKKDMLNLKHLIHSNLADKATPTHERYSQREIKDVPNVDISKIRKEVDMIAKKYRELDMKIQECNWMTDLI